MLGIASYFQKIVIAFLCCKYTFCVCLCFIRASGQKFPLSALKRFMYVDHVPNICSLKAKNGYLSFIILTFSLA